MCTDKLFYAAGTASQNYPVGTKAATGYIMVNTPMLPYNSSWKM